MTVMRFDGVFERLTVFVRPGRGVGDAVVAIATNPPMVPANRRVALVVVAAATGLARRRGLLSAARCAAAPARAAVFDRPTGYRYGSGFRSPRPPMGPAARQPV